MIETHATVESVIAGRTRIRVHRRQACGGCGHRDAGCGAGALQRWMARRGDMVFDVVGNGGFRQGDQVVLGLTPVALSRAIWCAYGWPLAGLMSGAVCVGLASGNDAGTLFGALTGLFVGLGMARRMAGVVGSEPRILRTLAGHRMQSPAA